MQSNYRQSTSQYLHIYRYGRESITLLILSIVPETSRCTRLKLHLHMQYVSDKNKKHLRNMQRHRPLFGIIAMQIARKQSFQPIASRLESELCYSQIGENILRTPHPHSHNYSDTKPRCTPAHIRHGQSKTAYTKKGL